MRFSAVCFAILISLVASVLAAPLEHSDVQQAYLDVPWDYRSSSGPVLRLPYGVIFGPTRGFHASSVTASEYREFLTVDHALRDIDKFVKEVVNPDGSLRVIIAGSGYGARLAGWYHQESQGKTAGAVLDSPPSGNTAASFRAYDFATKILPADCLAGLRNVTATLAQKLREGDMTALRQKLGLCSDPDLSSERLIGFFWHTIMFPIVRAIGHTSNSFTKPKATLANVCARLTVGQDRVWDHFPVLLKETREDSQACVRVDYADWMRLGGSNDEVVTLVQQCLELAAFPTSEGDSSAWVPSAKPATISTMLFDDLCQSFLGPKFSFEHALKKQEALRRRFGSNQYLGSNAFFIRSQGDPFLSLVPTAVRESSSVLIQYSGRRGETFVRESTSDSGELKELRFKLGKFLDALLF
jgi:pimeloyl-ACP methyl ester carboxylesterase